MEYPMKRVVVRQFGDVDQLDVLDEPTPQPGRGQVLVRLTSIGMNHADLMARRGEYRLSSGDPPFTPGLEGGGVIEAVGADVSDPRSGD
jgi:NADPH:quinone reductase-like Zn-dependent oxidoreductase